MDKNTFHSLGRILAYLAEQELPAYISTDWDLLVAWMGDHQLDITN